MKICIPVTSPEGLESAVEPHLPDAAHILIFDLLTRQYEQIDLAAQNPASSTPVRMDAVLCGSLNRMTLRALAQQGIKIYGMAAETVAQAIAQFENGELECVEVPAGGCGRHAGEQGYHRGGCCGGEKHDETGGGCCGGQGHGHEQGGGCCGGEKHDEAGGGCCGGHGHEGEAQGCCGEGGSCEGHDHGDDGGCAHGGEGKANEPARKPADEKFKIAVCSQNRKTVTEHAGKCRKFWVYDIEQGRVVGKNLLELAKEQSFHETTHGQEHPLDGVAIMLGASMGDGLKRKLDQRGIQGVLTTQNDPDQAVAVLLASWQ